MGTFIAVILPMPLVVLDPSFSAAGVALALLLPLSAHAFAGNVLEPLLFGHTLKLHPVAILLSLLLWGTVWGVTGMVLAVPITAVVRIRLNHINHPLPQWVASLLVGQTQGPSPLPHRTVDEDDEGASGSYGHPSGPPSGLLRSRVGGPMTPLSVGGEDARGRLLGPQAVEPRVSPIAPLQAVLDGDEESGGTGGGGGRGVAREARRGDVEQAAVAHHAL